MYLGHATGSASPLNKSHHHFSLQLWDLCNELIPAHPSFAADSVPYLICTLYLVLISVLPSAKYYERTSFTGDSGIYGPQAICLITASWSVWITLSYYLRWTSSPDLKAMDDHATFPRRLPSEPDQDHCLLHQHASHTRTMASR